MAGTAPQEVPETALTNAPGRTASKCPATELGALWLPRLRRSVCREQVFMTPHKCRRTGKHASPCGRRTHHQHPLAADQHPARAEGPAQMLS